VQVDGYLKDLEYYGIELLFLASFRAAMEKSSRRVIALMPFVDVQKYCKDVANAPPVPPVSKVSQLVEACTQGRLDDMALT